MLTGTDKVPVVIGFRTRENPSVLELCFPAPQGECYLGKNLEEVGSESLLGQGRY